MLSALTDMSSALKGAGRLTADIRLAQAIFFFFVFSRCSGQSLGASIEQKTALDSPIKPNHANNLQAYTMLCDSPPKLRSSGGRPQAVLWPSLDQHSTVRTAIRGDCGDVLWP